MTWPSRAARNGCRLCLAPQRVSVTTLLRRRVSLVQPSVEAVVSIAAHCEGWSAPSSQTIRTARSRTPGEYVADRPIGFILATNGPSDSPGTVHGDDIMRLKLAVWLVLMVLVVALDVSAQTPRVVRQSGVVRDEAGQPRAGGAMLTFGIYAEVEGGVLLWTEVQVVTLDR